MKKVKTKIWRKIFLSINFIVQEVLIYVKIFFEGEQIGVFFFLYPAIFKKILYQFHPKNRKLRTSQFLVLFPKIPMIKEVIEAYNYN